jgi:hypothetical protein
VVGHKTRYEDKDLNFVRTGVFAQTASQNEKAAATKMIEYEGWQEDTAILQCVREGIPAVFRRTSNPDYRDIILSTLRKVRQEVDVSCNTSDLDDFCGNPIFREKVNLRAADFVDAWVQHRDGKHHWVLDADLHLYLSQCCFACPSDATICDLDPSHLHVPAPAILLHPDFSCTQSNLWMNLQQARSTLHYDGSDNILVLVDGTKHVTLISPIVTPQLQPVPASDDNPNHSTLSFAEVEQLVSEMETKHNQQENQSKRNAYSVTLHAGDALYIPEGWWHQVFSEPCSMALNFWFSCTSNQSTTSTTQYDTPIHDDAPQQVRAHQRPYELRKLVHSLLSEERAKQSQALAGCLVTSPLYRTCTTYAMFESNLLSMLHPTLNNSETTAPTSKREALSIDSAVPALVCVKRPAGEQLTPHSSKYSATESQHNEESATENSNRRHSEEFWMEFVQCGVGEQRRLWLPFAQQVGLHFMHTGSNTSMNAQNNRSVQFE